MWHWHCDRLGRCDLVVVDVVFVVVATVVGIVVAGAVAAVACVVVACVAVVEKSSSDCYYAQGPRPQMASWKLTS